MKLGALIADTGVRLSRDLDLEISGLSADSRRVEPGYLFCAVAGHAEDGGRFVGDALGRGAVAVAARTEPALPVDVPWLPLEDDRRDWGRLCDRFFGEPSRDLDVVGITGTNGKTTTAWLVEAVLAHARGGCGLLGTVQISTGRRREDAAMTTPAAEDLHRLLAEMRDAGLDCAAMEISSHALDQRRADAVRLAVAVFTRLGRDHLDYHGDAESYRAAKARLVTLLRSGGTLVLNEDDPAMRDLEPAPGDRVIRYRARGAARADRRLESVAETLAGLEADLAAGGGRARFRCSLFGFHNRENVLAAAAAGLALGLDLETVARGLETFSGVTGRVERVRVDAPFRVVVDYAHTPDAFDVVLGSLAALAEARLIVVFGCGGERDRGKRAEMGRLVEARAALVFVTEDNPRGERTADIVADILGGMEHPERARVELDRGEAIRAALDAARAGDLLLLAGKGHEREQIVGAERRPWDDRAVVRDWERARARREG
ncbi:MAG: UDP-N-acetylmuramoyl-L-alanyl-D-glutamate--2,6-diaminopimelate ligase [Planctomycetota bacterium]